MCFHKVLIPEEGQTVKPVSGTYEISLETQVVHHESGVYNTFEAHECRFIQYDSIPLEAKVVFDIVAVLEVEVLGLIPHEGVPVRESRIDRRRL